jgi:hypothetical protein
MHVKNGKIHSYNFCSAVNFIIADLRLNLDQVNSRIQFFF